MISYKSHVEVESNDNMKLTRPHVAAGDSLPGAGEHLQHGDDEHAQGGGPHRHRGLDARMHPLRLRRAHRVRGDTLQVSS